MNPDFLGAFLLVITMIAAGYFLRRKNVVTADGKKAITAVIWKVALPCMAFVTFLQDFAYEDFLSGISVFIGSAVLYFAFMVLGRLLFRRFGKRRANVAAFMLSLGQLTLFTMPLLRSLGSDRAMLYCGIMTLVFRFMLYFVALTTIAGEDGGSFRRSAKKAFWNPVMIAMLLGMFIFLCQGFLPQVNGVCVFRIDKTLPALYKVLSALSDMVSPLAMLLIGMNIGACNIKKTLQDGPAWLCGGMRTLLCPLLVLCVTRLLSFFFNPDAALAMTLGLAAPASVTISIFCSTYEYEEEFASHITVTSTLLCVITVPVIYALSMAWLF